jgi:hypothetical protein
MKNLLNYFDLLPSSLLDNIFEYDVTYREKYMNDDVKIELWGESIKMWSRQYVIPPENCSNMGGTVNLNYRLYFDSIMNYLVNTWCMDLHKKNELKKTLMKKFYDCKVIIDKKWDKFNTSDDIDIFVRAWGAENHLISLRCKSPDSTLSFDGHVFQNVEYFENWIKQHNKKSWFDENWKQVYSDGKMILFQLTPCDVNRLYADVISLKDDIRYCRAYINYRNEITLVYSACQIEQKYDGPPVIT